MAEHPLADVRSRTRTHHAIELGFQVGRDYIHGSLRALTEPMWSNDFLAIWGLKGKAIFAAGAVLQILGMVGLAFGAWAAVLVLIGLLLYEHAHISAAQSVPLA